MSKLVPVELITDILCRLPVKSLLRFRCVSKSWSCQIDDPYFIKLHLNRSLKTNTNLSLILENKGEFLSVELDTLDTAIKLNNPIEDGGGFFTGVFGCCNGLVALYKCHNRLPDHVLWNPSTRKYHTAPTPIEDLRDFSTSAACRSIAYGFGYDPVSDDYKLVRILVYCHRNQHKSQVEIYSLKSNSWRQTRDLPFHHCYHPLGNGTLANNTLHWNVSIKSERDSANRIVAFDLRVEDYFEVPLPDYMDNNYCCIDVESLGGCLCLICDYAHAGVDIWVMKEYGVKESWIKLVSMAQIEVFLKPLAYSKGGDRVLLYEDDMDDDDGDKFVWYDVRGKRAEEVRIQGAPKSYEVKMCVASLVPLSGGNGTNATKQRAPVKKEE